MNNFEEIQEILKEEYEKLGNGPDYTKKEMDVQDIYIDTATIEIIKAYDRKNNTDIQAVLKAYLEPTTMEKIKASVLGNDIAKIKEKEQKEIERTISSSGVSVNSKAKDEIEKEVEENKENRNNEQVQEEDLRKVVLKAMYKSVLEEYYALKQNIQEVGFNSQISTGDISTTNKLGTELVLYEKYLKDIDNRYRGIAKVDIIRDDEEIKDFETKFVLNDEKSEKAILKKNDENISQVVEVYNERNSIATDIANLSSKANIIDTDEFNRQMDILQNEYVKLSAKLYNLNPNPLEIEESIQRRNEDEKFRNREVGSKYKRVHENNLGSNATTKIDENAEKIEENVKEANVQLVNVDNEQEKSIDIIIENYKEAEARGNYEKAEELLQSLEQIAGIKSEEISESNANKMEEKNPQEIEEEQAMKNRFFDPRLAATNNDDKVAKIEAAKQDRATRYKVVVDKLDIKRETTDVKVKDDYVPTLQTNKRGY